MTKSPSTLALSLVILSVILVTAVDSASIYNTQKSYVTQLTNVNFDNQVSKIRQNTNQVSVVHFYKESGMNFNLLFRWKIKGLCRSLRHLDQ
jgi:hypothetical protein